MKITCKATRKKDGKEFISLPEPIKIEFEYDLGTDALDAIDKHGDNVVHQQFVAGATVALQNVARTMAEGGSTPGEIATYMSNYKLGTKRDRVTVTTQEAAMRLLKGMSEEERAAFFAKLDSGE
ncbi:MAG: hypothetical protein EHM79_00260 [Geobacter sp.]|nr:MAG: hypothetical protein EHM79_00260 [Geobacter sp.]